LPRFAGLNPMAILPPRRSAFQEADQAASFNMNKEAVALNNQPGEGNAYQKNIVQQQGIQNAYQNHQTANNQYAVSMIQQASKLAQANSTQENLANNLALYAKTMTQEQAGVQGIAPAFELANFIKAHGPEVLDPLYY